MAGGSRSTRGAGCRVFHDPSLSADSEIARLVQRYPIKSCNVIIHIRRANRGRICLENTRPFVRDLWGRVWTFAHNGQLKEIKKRPLAHYRPVGTTDSERAFCWLLEQVRGRYPEPPKRRLTLWRLVADLCGELNTMGVFNMLLCDSRQLYAFCGTKLSWITRRAPFGEARLIDADMVVDFCKEMTHNDVISVIATQPLTDNEQWQVMAPGELQIFSEGEPIL